MSHSQHRDQLPLPSVTALKIKAAVLTAVASVALLAMSGSAVAFSFGPGGTGPGELGDNGSRIGLSVSPSGELWVADTWNHRINVYSPSGAFQSSMPISGLPDHVVADDSALYVGTTDGVPYGEPANTPSLRKYSDSGDLIWSVSGADLRVPAPGHEGDSAIALRGSKLFAASYLGTNSSRQMKVTVRSTENGALLDEWTVSGWMEGLIASDDQELIMDDLYATKKLLRFTETGEQIGTFGIVSNVRRGGALGGDASGKVVVADECPNLSVSAGGAPTHLPGTCRIREYDTSGKYVRSIIIGPGYGSVILRVAMGQGSTIFASGAPDNGRGDGNYLQGLDLAKPEYPEPENGPQGVSIDDGAQFTNEPKVVINAVWPLGASAALVANDGGFRRGISSPLSSGISWKLDSSGPERLPKTIYVRFSGFAIDETKTFQDDIILDETPPVIASAGIASLASITSARKLRTYRIKVRASDKTSGVATAQVATDKLKKKLSVPQKYRASLSVRATGKPLWVRVRDRAGNFSKWKKLP